MLDLKRDKKKIPENNIKIRDSARYDFSLLHQPNPYFTVFSILLTHTVCKEYTGL